VQHLFPEGFVDHFLNLVLQRWWLIFLHLSHIGP
jgi:hypothetical protein